LNIIYISNQSIGNI